MENQKFRPITIYVECNADISVIGDKWTITLTFPKMLYDAIMLKEENGKKTSTFPVKVVVKPAKK